MYGVSFWVLVIAHSFQVGVGKNASFTCPGLLYSSQGYCGFSHPYLQNSPFGGGGGNSPETIPFWECHLLPVGILIDKHALPLPPYWWTTSSISSSNSNWSFLSRPLPTTATQHHTQNHSPNILITHNTYALLHLVLLRFYRGYLLHVWVMPPYPPQTVSSSG